MRKFIINVNGKSYEVDVEEVKDGSTFTPPVASVSAPAAAAPTPTKEAPNKAPAAAAAPEGAENVKSPMPGNILKINVSVGDTVTEGQVLLVLEAMKMENDIVAPRAGKVVSISVSKGASVDSGDVLVSIA